MQTVMFIKAFRSRKFGGSLRKKQFSRDETKQKNDNPGTG